MGSTRDGEAMKRHDQHGCPALLIPNRGPALLSCTIHRPRFKEHCRLCVRNPVSGIPNVWFSKRCGIGMVGVTEDRDVLRIGEELLIARRQGGVI